MTLGRSSSGAIKIKTDSPKGLRAVSCGCCESQLNCGAVKITDQNLIDLLNSATSGSFNYSHGTDSSPLWVSTGPNSFRAEWNCCFNNPDGCDNCFFSWEYICILNWSQNTLGLQIFDFPWGYLATPENGQCSECNPPETAYITINGHSILMGMRYGCGAGMPIYPVSINLT